MLASYFQYLVISLNLSACDFSLLFVNSGHLYQPSLNQRHQPICLPSVMRNSKLLKFAGRRSRYHSSIEVETILRLAFRVLCQIRRYVRELKITCTRSRPYQQVSVNTPVILAQILIQTVQLYRVIINDLSHSSSSSVPLLPLSGLVFRKKSPPYFPVLCYCLPVINSHISSITLSTHLSLDLPALRVP
jgi:hypothetical protein